MRVSDHLSLALEGPARLLNSADESWESGIACLDENGKPQRDVADPKICTRYGQLFRGWFVPPATTRYRFRMACDDFCTLKLATKPGDGSLSILEELLDVKSWSSQSARYWANSTDFSRVTPW